MAGRTGGQLNPNTGRVEKGRIPKGSCEEPATFKEGPFKRLMGRNR